MRILNLNTPHTPDHNRVAVETTLTDIITTGLDLPADRVQVSYFAAPGLAIILIVDIEMCVEVDRLTSKASRALRESGYGIHFWDNSEQGPVRGKRDYRAQIVVNIP